MFTWEEVLFGELYPSFVSATLSAVSDVWVWPPHSSGLFLVSSTYLLLSRALSRVLRLFDELLGILNKVWKSIALSKVVSFSWQLLLDIVPSRPSLFRRGVISYLEDAVCIFCQNAYETSLHLFCSCSFSSSIWYANVNWLDFDFVMQLDIPSLFLQFMHVGVPLQCRHGLMLI